ncbi:multidrug effflux MFS transporter [Marinobacter sp. X15-166B]|uniref:multidrug effflux MFS transporter n=1 Tax=Marinobacter sp. X15-166B TaxID=1897620 RepID=UPI00085C9CDB|nr:multidrug effflux MFS transporter [Marinobacter sp. X15-166B]OEY65877.1 Bcr/CflA family drug resistance efflux transporter [Marinobacter sp. X15-166B]
MLALTSIWTTVLLAAAVALGPLATDMYLPALPGLGAALAAGPDKVQMTLSAYLIGFALAQLFCGPLADRFGRKPVMIGGFLVFAAASVGCALATDIETLILCRFLQAVGGSAGPVLGRAAIRDIYQPREAARIMAILASIMALAPAIAPTLGGLMLKVFGWSSIFMLLAGYGAIMMVVIAVGIPEPMSPAHRQSLRLGRLLANYRTIVSDRTFVSYTLTNALIFSSFFAFLSGSPFVLIDFMGVATDHFGLYFACIVAGYIAGNLSSVRLSRALSPDQLLLRGLLIAALAGSAMAALAMAEVFNVWAVIVPQVVLTFGVGMVLPQTMAGALANFPGMAGSASALFGFLQMAVAAGAGMLVGVLYSGSSLEMALIIAAAALSALLCYILLVQRHPAQGFESLT